MSKIYVAVYGSGLGHATRTLTIVNNLRYGNDFSFSSFDEGLKLLKERGESVNRSPSVALSWDDTGGISGQGTFLSFPLAMSSFARQVSFELDKIADFNPNVVLSDSRLSAVVAARSKSLPIVTILNQLKILFPPRFRSGIFSRLLERIEGNILGLFWTMSDKLLFPDLPPPFTIGEANIANLDVADKVVFTGFMVPRIQTIEADLDKVRAALELNNGRQLVYIQISGPKPTKPHFIEVARDSISSLSKKYNVVFSLGEPGANETAQKLSNGCWLFEWCPVKEQLFIISDLIVARAGHTTLSQCINLGKPAVIVPVFNQSEQLWNAKKFEKLGLGLKIDAEKLSPKTLTDAIENCLLDESYKSNIERIKLFSQKFDGVASATEILKTYL